MRPAVVTAVLLLVGAVIAVKGLSDNEVARNMCDGVHPIRCDGSLWVTFDWTTVCMKYFETPKSFFDAQAHCRSIDSELVSIHNAAEMLNVLCISHFYNTGAGRRSFWIGSLRSQGKFIHTDGTVFKYSNWLPNQPDNYRGKEGCAEMNAVAWGKWNDAPCSMKKDFVCKKRK